MELRRVAFLFLLALATVFGGYNLGRALLGPKQGEDFAQYYVAGRAVLDGEGTALYDTGAAYRDRAARYGVKGVPLGGEAGAEIAGVMTFAYPPFTAVAATPFALLPYRASRLLFFAISLIAALLAPAILFADREGEWRKEMIAVGLVATIIFFPTHYSLYMGQVNAMLLLACAGALHFARRKRPLAAGLCLAFAASIKIFPLVLVVPLVARRKYRAAIFTVAGIALFAAFAAAVCGADTWRVFFTDVLPGQYSGGAWYRNQGYFGFLARLLTPNDFVDSIGNFPAATATAAAVLGAATLIAAAGKTLSYRYGVNGLDLSFALFLTATLLALSKSWEHYGVFLLPSYLFLYERIRTRSTGRRALPFTLFLSFCAWSFVLNTGVEYGSLPHHVLANVVFSLKFFATLALFGCHFFVMRNGKRESDGGGLGFSGRSAAG